MPAMLFSLDLMSQDLLNLGVPLTLLGLICLAAIYFAQART
jgi:hypothetical protein